MQVGILIIEDQETGILTNPRSFFPTPIFLNSTSCSFLSCLDEVEAMASGSEGLARSANSVSTKDRLSSLAFGSCLLGVDIDVVARSVRDAGSRATRATKNAKRVSRICQMLLHV